MRRAYSPSKPGRYAAQPTPPPSSLRRRSRWLYVLLTLLGLYLYLSPRPLSFLPRHSSSPPSHAPSLRFTSIDWSRYAYSQFATTSAHLCNSVMIFEALSRLGSKPQRILYYPSSWDTEISSPRDRDSQLLVKAREWYNVKLIPIDGLEIVNSGSSASSHSLVRFLPWAEMKYERILHLDSDVTMLKHLDEVFLLPRTSVAMMRAFWELPTKRLLSPKLVLLEPSDIEFQMLTGMRQRSKEPVSEILNRHYGDSAMVLPHRQYGLLSSEFRNEEHENYLGNNYDVWDPEMMMQEVSLVYFSDWPLPKPWIMWPHNLIGKMTPECRLQGGQEDCRNKKIWLELYDEFRKRRKVILQSMRWLSKN